MSDKVPDTFPYRDVVIATIHELRGPVGAKTWSEFGWGSHWYVSLEKLLENAVTPREAELLVIYLLLLSSTRDDHASALRERLFTEQVMDFAKNTIPQLLYGYYRNPNIEDEER